MADRLNVYDEEVINNIEKEFKGRIDKAYGNSIKTTKKLVDMIQFYREHSFNEVCDRIENIGKKTFLTIDDNSAFKSALYENFEKQYEGSVGYDNLTDIDKFKLINNEINKILPYTSREDKKNAADKYRQDKYNEYVQDETNNALILYELFNSIEAEEVKDYMALFQEFKYNEELLDARLESIRFVAKKTDKDLPLCLVDKMSTKAVENEVRHAVRIEEQNDDNKSLKDRVKARAKYILEVLEENSNIAAKISTAGFMIGGLASLGVFAITRDGGLSAATIAATSSFVIAALGVGYRKISIKDDKDSVDESKALGVFDRKVRVEQKERAFLDYDKYLKKKYSDLKIEGGNNGLQQ